MALKPVVKLKVDELFLRWLSETETQHLLKTNLRQILNGEALTPGLPTPPRSGRPQSPRVRSAGDTPPPCSPSSNSKVTSPRSPRRVALKNQAYRNYGKVGLPEWLKLQGSPQAMTAGCKSGRTTITPMGKLVLEI